MIEREVSRSTGTRGEGRLEEYPIVYIRRKLWEHMVRSYDVEYTRSRPISEVKLRSARPVLGTEMAWEALVTNLLPFSPVFLLVNALQTPLAIQNSRKQPKRPRIEGEIAVAASRPRFTRLFCDVQRSNRSGFCTYTDAERFEEERSTFSSF